MAIARVEKAGVVVFTDGQRTKKLPEESWCRERLISLLEEAGGNQQDERVIEFWKERAKAIATDDELMREWASETFLVLEKVWDQLTTTTTTTQPADAFAAFGM